MAEVSGFTSARSIDPPSSLERFPSPICKEESWPPRLGLTPSNSLELDFCGASSVEASPGAEGMLMFEPGPWAAAVRVVRLVSGSRASSSSPEFAS